MSSLLQGIAGALSPLWSGLKTAVGTPFNWLKDAAKKVGDFTTGIDRWLQNGQNDALLGGIAKSIYQSPIYRGIQDVIQGGIGVIDDVDRIGGDIARTIDSRLDNFGSGRAGSNNIAPSPAPRPDMSVSPINRNPAGPNMGALSSRFAVRPRGGAVRI